MVAILGSKLSCLFGRTNGLLCVAETFLRLIYQEPGQAVVDPSVIWLRPQNLSIDREAGMDGRGVELSGLVPVLGALVVPFQFVVGPRTIFETGPQIRLDLRAATIHLVNGRQNLNR